MIRRKNANDMHNQTRGDKTKPKHKGNVSPIRDAVLHLKQSDYVFPLLFFLQSLFFLLVSPYAHENRVFSFFYSIDIFWFFLVLMPYYPYQTNKKDCYPGAIVEQYISYDTPVHHPCYIAPSCTAHSFSTIVILEIWQEEQFSRSDDWLSYFFLLTHRDVSIFSFFDITKSCLVHTQQRKRFPIDKVVIVMSTKRWFCIDTFWSCHRLTQSWNKNIYLLSLSLCIALICCIIVWLLSFSSTLLFHIDNRLDTFYDIAIQQERLVCT